jgi:spermidine synthase
MLGVTTHITTDIAAVSFFWVLPLAIYLATFVVAFSTYGESFSRAARFVLPFFIVIALIRLFRNDGGSLQLIGTELGIFTCVSLVLHNSLYRSRPQSTRLTDFYLWVALGGCLGGLLNGIIAPMLFPDIIEYPLVLTLGILIVEWPVIRAAGRIWRTGKWNGLRPGETVIIVVVALLVSVSLIGARDPETTVLMAGLFLTSLLAATYAAGTRTGIRGCIGLCFLIHLGVSIAADLDPSIHSGRTFFGAFRVDDTIEHDAPIRRLLHGTTLHGLQAKDPESALSVQSYYKILEEITQPHISASGPVSIGITGLGTGTLACMGRPEDHVTFFEIDPVVEEVARQYFTFLDGCPPKIDVVLGDARLTLRDIEDATYDILVLDAFSSDSVPVHLLTNEAAALYERVLKEDGLMAFHISNRYIDLRPILGRLAEHRNWVAWEVFNERRESRPFERTSTFILASRNELAKDLLSGVNGAKQLDAPTGLRLWTDDYSNLLRVLRF